jgi:hypothetical protein
MGSRPLVLDHQLLVQLWSDPFFWECVPSWEADRELAEMEVAATLEDQSSLSVRHSELYNAWISQLEFCVSTDPDKVKQITDYIHKKRKYRQEQIVLPAAKTRRTLVLLSNGVEKCQDESG